jgi:hypothetical protein
MKLPPVISDIFCDNDLATMSVDAPGANATNKVTGLALGHSDCAQLVALIQLPSIKQPHNFVR